MTLHVRDAATWKTVTSLLVRDGGTWKSVTAGYVRDGGTWKQFYSSSGGGGGGGYSVTLSPNPAQEWGQTFNFNPTGYVSINIGATPSGFTSPTYSWTRVSGPSDAGAFSAYGVTTNSVNIGATLPCGAGLFSETWRCTVTEGANSAYADVVVSLAVDNLN